MATKAISGLSTSLEGFIAGANDTPAPRSGSEVTGSSGGSVTAILQAASTNG